MFLENLVVDAADPSRLGRFWAAVVGGETLTDEPAGFETRLAVENGPVLDLCFQPATPQSAEPQRLHLDLLGGAHRGEVVDRLLELGARSLDRAQQDGTGMVLVDPEGNRCDVVPDQGAYIDTGPIAALRLESGNPDRDVEFWSWLTGWVDAPGVVPRTLRHESMRGPVLQLCPEAAPKGPAKNRMHLDIRLETGDDPEDVAAGIAERGGHELRPDWGDLPWRVHADPSGNEFCVLPARS